MRETLNEAKILVCVGSGGVGKTTVAAALGFWAANLGRKVLVLTIDPAQRLKTTLGLKDSGEITEVAGHFGKGKVFASVINAKRTFDEFFLRATTTAGVKPEVIQRILKNRLYVQLSTTLSGSQEFTALEKLYACYESGEYDLIILDTPPTKHAIDFLQAPQKLAALFNAEVADWFLPTPEGTKGKGKYWMSRILNAGTVQVMRALETLTGSEFMGELRDFFQNIASWRGRLEDRIIAVQQLLVADGTQFVLVASSDHAKLLEAEFFSREIRKGGMHLSSIILNRAFPFWFDQDDRAASSVPLYNRYNEYLHERDRELKQFAKHIADNVAGDFTLYQLPELAGDIADVRGVQEFMRIMQKEMA